MDKIICGLPYVFVYLDSILIASKDRKEHAQHLREVCQLLHGNGLVINADKLGVPELSFLV